MSICVFALSSMGHVKFRFKSVQIILNYIMLEPKTKVYDIFFQEAIKLSVSLMGHHTEERFY